ncbi:MAG: MBL fold metallo-hydrolase [Pirellulales bacterium]|nr:MBL fold metallo-hydrolase [Pirellulales bacterium]
MIQLAFYGAAGEVTGSCYVLSTDRAQVMVDMGMFQGEKDADEKNRRLPAVELGKLDAVVLTHAHLDHCGRLPLLVQHGYRGRIHCTAATADVAEIILRDSAYLQKEDYERALRHRGNHKRQKNHGASNHKQSRNNIQERNRSDREAPLYTEQEVERLLPHFSPLGYGQTAAIAEGISITLFDAGHILGASSVRMTIQDGERTMNVVFSGDVGPVGAPILRDPRTPAPADVLLLESTYGDRDHRSLDATRDELLAILKQAEASHGNVIIPAFAVGRTQDIVFHIGEFIRAGKLDPTPVIIDSPMAVSVTQLYARHTQVYDERAVELLHQQMKPLSFPGVRFTHSVEESKGLNDVKGGQVIVSANGMCTGGRILHHLRHNLPDPNAHVVIVGYQGNGTLGRRLVDGAKFVSIFGNDIKVRAKTHTLGGFSAHAGQTGLANWVEPLQSSNPRLFLTHGEDGPRRELANVLQKRYALSATFPQYGNIATL